MFNKEFYLLDNGVQTNDCDTKYEVKEDDSGINLESFNIDHQRMNVEEVIEYVAWNAGKFNPGAGQLGIYRLREVLHGAEQYALIRDYRTVYDNWSIVLMDVTETESKMKDELAVDTWGLSFTDYLFK